MGMGIDNSLYTKGSAANFYTEARREIPNALRGKSFTDYRQQATSHFEKRINAKEVQIKKAEQNLDNYRFLQIFTSILLGITALATGVGLSAVIGIKGLAYSLVSIGFGLAFYYLNEVDCQKASKAHAELSEELASLTEQAEWFKEDGTYMVYLNRNYPTAGGDYKERARAHLSELG